MYYVIKKYKDNSLKMFKITSLEEEIAPYINNPTTLFTLTSYKYYYESVKNVTELLSFQDKYDFGIEDCEWISLETWYIRASDTVTNTSL
ncbi:hypothetical protein [Lacrimispora sp.]|jgi:hypothetical protein|uniref:hypothetical protein n=1 Tax=Lacrimispora sp. TaxID=2719234 RepID=UPI0028AC7B5D|nr:hypothetical protein [Lacrimispora sp.]